MTISAVHAQRRDHVSAGDDGNHELWSSSRAARLPLALARRAAEVMRMVNAVAKLEERGEAITSRSLAEAAHISPSTACAWLRKPRNGRYGADSSVISSAL